MLPLVVAFSLALGPSVTEASAQVENRCNEPSFGSHTLEFYTTKDGSRSYFGTLCTLVAEDDDSTQFDFYEYSANGLRYFNLGPSTSDQQDDFDHRVLKATEDGSRILVETGAQATPDDTDRTRDLFLIEGTATTLLTSWEVNGADDSRPLREGYVDATDDLGAVFFFTDEALVPEDEDTATDVYRSRDGAIELVSGSTGVGTSDDAPVHPRRFPVRFSDDGNVVLFSTEEQLAPGDTNDVRDVYRWRGGAIDLISEDAAPGEVNDGAYPADVSADGEDLLFQSSNPLLSSDTRSPDDAYLWRSDQLFHLSPGLSGEFESWGVSDLAIAGSKVFFQTRRALVEADENESEDAYEWDGGQLRLLARTPGGESAPDGTLLRSVGGDGRSAIVRTSSALVAADTNGRRDTYEVRDGTAALRTARSDGTSPDRAFPVTTAEQISSDARAYAFVTAGDIDRMDDDCSDGDPPGCYDIYVSTPDGISLVSGAYGPQGEFGHLYYYPYTHIPQDLQQLRPHLRSVSDDGRTVYFESKEALVPEDDDDLYDLYIWHNGQTKVVSNEFESQFWPTPSEAPAPPSEDEPPGGSTGGGGSGSSDPAADPEGGADSGSESGSGGEAPASPGGFDAPVAADDKVAGARSKVRRKARIQGRRLRIKGVVACAEPCQVNIRGKVKSGGKQFKLGTTRRSTRAGQKVRYRLKLKGGKKRQINRTRKLIRRQGRGKTPKVKVVAKFRDGANNATKEKVRRRIKIK